MAPHNERTVIINSGFPKEATPADIAKAIVDHFGPIVEAIQACPGRQYRITFATPAGKRYYDDLEIMSIGDVQCRIWRASPYSNVLVYHYPFEGSDVKIVNFLKQYGVVESIKRQVWTGLKVSTGTRIVRMIRQSQIPRLANIDGLKCKVWYKEQPIECDICHDGHKAAQCPHKGKCFTCRQPGHVSRDCPQAWYRQAEEAPVVNTGPDPDPTAAESPSAHDGSPPDPTSDVSAPVEDLIDVPEGSADLFEAAQSLESSPLAPADDSPVDSVDLSDGDPPTDLRNNQLDEVASQPSPVEAPSQSPIHGSSGEAPSPSALAVNNMSTAAPSASGGPLSVFVPPLPVPRNRASRSVRPSEPRSVSRSRSRSKSDHEFPPDSGSDSSVSAGPSGRRASLSPAKHRMPAAVAPRKGAC